MLAKTSQLSAAVRDIKRRFPDITVMTDVCLCAYTSHGHCGILEAKSEERRARNAISIDREATVEMLAKIAVSHAQAGADYVAPSAMAKKQVLAIRRALDKEGLKGIK